MTAEGQEGTEAEVPEGTTPVESAPEHGETSFEQLDPNTVVTIKVGGEEIEVPLAEALQGYQRQADYTRKAQEVAQLRKEAEQGLRIQQALARDPAAALKVLAEHHRVSFAQDNDDFESDPGDERVNELARQVDALNAQLRQTAIDREVNALTAKYGDDIDVDAVMSHAVQNGFPSLRAAYADLVLDDAYPAFQQVSRRQQQDEVVIGLKRQTAVAATGGNGSSGVKQTVPKGQKVTPRQAYELAQQGIEVPRWSPEDWKK